MSFSRIFSLVLLFLGAVCLLAPAAVIGVVSVLAGIALLLGAVFRGNDYLRDRRLATLLSALSQGLLGLWLLRNRTAGAKTLFVVLGIYVLLSAVPDLVKMIRGGSSRTAVLLQGGVVLLGALCVLYAFGAARLAVRLLGVGLLAAGGMSFLAERRE